MLNPYKLSVRICRAYANRTDPDQWRQIRVSTVCLYVYLNKNEKIPPKQRKKERSNRSEWEIPNVLDGTRGGGGGGYSYVFSYVGSGPASTVHPPPPPHQKKISGISCTPKNI